jgi:hypothetical protein
MVVEKLVPITRERHPSCDEEEKKSKGPTVQANTTKSLPLYCAFRFSNHETGLTLGENLASTRLLFGNKLNTFIKRP